MGFLAARKYERLSRGFLFSIIFCAIHFSGGVEAAISATTVQQISPQYPDSERAARHEGRAVISVTILKDGSEASATIVESSGWPMLDAAALDTARLWKFAPALDDLGRPIDSTKNIGISFSLTDAPPLSAESVEQLLSKWADVVEERQTLMTTLSLCDAGGMRRAEAKSLSKPYEDILTRAVEGLATQLRPKLAEAGVADPVANMLEGRKALEKNKEDEVRGSFNDWDVDKQTSICNQVIDRLNQGLKG